MSFRFMTATTTDLRGVRYRSRLSAAVCALLAVTACGGGDLLLPKDGEPALITPFSGNNQTDTVGQTLSESLVVEVTDPGGRPVSGVEVLFVPPSSAVVAPGDRVTTGSNGQAAVHYTLGPAAGEQMVEARTSIVPATNAVAVFRVSAEPDIPEALTLAGGNGQNAQVSTVLPVPLAVRAVDRFGNGVAGIEVTWQASGGGEVSPATVVTGPDGQAAAMRTLGERPGSYGAVARAEGLEGSPISFNSTAVAAPRPELVLITQPSASAAAGVPLEQQPEIQLQDPLGAPLNQEGVSVTVQIAGGEGSLGGRTSATSNANGRVRFADLELRGETGSRRLIFAADGFTPVTSTDIAVRPGPPAPAQSSVSVPNGTAGIATTISVVLKDEFGNNIEGAGNDLSIGITGSNPASGLPVTEDGNGSYTAFYVPLRSGTDAVTVAVRGVSLGGPFPSNVAPGPADASTSTAVVTRTGVFFVQVDVLVTTRDAQGNPLGRGGNLVQIAANGGAPRSCAPPDGNEQTCLDNGDGTYSDSFIIIAGTVTVDISLNGVPLGGSPYTP